MVRVSSIEIRSLEAGYGDEPVLKSIDLHMEGPKLYCILGPNGVGKSTLIKCINGLLKPRSGTVSVNGRDVRDYNIRELSESIGYVPPSSAISFPVSVIDSLLISMDSGRKWKLDDNDVEAAYRALDIMNMSEYSLRNCNELSAGQMQKISICRGLVRRSGILLLDEPTSNLDVRHQLFITHFMQVLAHKSGCLVVMISHDLNLAARFADEVIVMCEPGRIYSMGKPSDVITETMIREVYSVDSMLLEVDGRPHIILKSAESW